MTVRSKISISLFVGACMIYASALSADELKQTRRLPPVNGFVPPRPTDAFTPTPHQNGEPRPAIGSNWIAPVAAAPRPQVAINSAWQPQGSQPIMPVARTAPGFSAPSPGGSGAWGANVVGGFAPPAQPNAAFSGPPAGSQGAQVGAPGGANQIPLPRQFGGRPVAPPQTPQESATLCGRLADKGKPLVACQVVIVPLEKAGQQYCLDKSRTPFRTTTDDSGIYYFENVPLGEYKMMWLPSGTRQWIRRISIKPDVFVKHEGINNIKDVRTALQTTN